MASLSVLLFLTGIHSEFQADDRFRLNHRLDPAQVSSIVDYFVTDYWMAALSALVLRFAAIGSLTPNPGATVISVGHGIRLSLWPTGQTIHYGHLRDEFFGWPGEAACWGTAGAVLVSALLPALAKAKLQLAVGFFAVALLPVSSSIPIGVLVAERAL